MKDLLIYCGFNFFDIKYKDMNLAKNNKMYSVLVVGIAIIYLATGLRKLFGAESIVTDFMSWGYSPLFMHFIGIIELLGAIALLIPQTRVLAIPSLGVVMLGAIGTHLLNGEYLQVLLPLVMLVLLGILFMMSREELESANLHEGDEAVY